jgi:methionine biosynthesis protein MetW
MLRIGRRAIVSFPNFGRWQVRLRLPLTGRMPRTRALDRAWYDTPNIHLCTISDVFALCEAGRKTPCKRNRRLANLFAEQGLFLLTRG